MGSRIIRNGDIEFGHEFPDKATEFARDGDNDLLFAFASGLEYDVALAEPILHAPRKLFDLLSVTQ